MSDPSADRDIKSDGLTRAQPSEAGVDVDAVIAFLNDVEAAQLDLHSLMLYRNGHVVAEAWRWPYRADRLRNLHSVAKSFTACAIGLALDEGRFRLDDKVVSFFPEMLPDVVSDGLAAMTVEDLLTMRVGHASETSGAAWRTLETSWIAEFLKIPVVERPGEVFLYTSAASYMLSAILSRKTGETLHDYLKPRLFEPLGIDGEAWDIGTDNINPGGNGLSTKTVDLLKLGILHLQNGMWEGKRVLPESWVSAATRAHDVSGRYGYHWWVHENRTYSAIGVFVQMVTVFPEQNAVLAVTGAIKGSSKLLPHIWRHFPAAFGAALPVDAAGSAATAADARLSAKLAEWQREDAPVAWKLPYLHARGAADDHTDEPSKVGTRRFTMQPNAQGIRELQLDLDATECRFSLTDADGEHVIVAGMDRWIESGNQMPGQDLHHSYRLVGSPVVARACWLDRSRLQMTWIFAETAFRDTVICEFHERQIVYRREVNINSGALRYDDVIGMLAEL
ncbi:serine hydrolase domain-containing protein [Paraburkholderia megapolitana]|uniref:CubicO group peptidase, beta-lactamase class C family n=1 Tax=Paraburkholderia megapolitana TaxID=420953 RepID=A0A1I3ERG4_9BURK|nr:serine hydrolase [Paraburkholderia megapolitana]QDQ80238.1 serine hydrolase [Paraburkholderia megapolitana]SFI01566.1 CubicO group peptidase, beta-lactamase class C family [Paraburkholderia megapolitana]